MIVCVRVYVYLIICITMSRQLFVINLISFPFLKLSAVWNRCIELIRFKRNHLRLHTINVGIHIYIYIFINQWMIINKYASCGITGVGRVGWGGRGWRGWGWGEGEGKNIFHAAGFLHTGNELGFGYDGLFWVLIGMADRVLYLPWCAPPMSAL